MLVQARPELQLQDGKYVTMAVKDTGAGIPQEHLSRIFDPYFTTKQEGTGLGLAITYSIVKNHGGAILVTSKPGRGSVLTVYLPATDAAPAEQAGGRPAVVQGRGRLVMDDEELVRMPPTPSWLISVSRWSAFGTGRRRSKPINGHSSRGNPSMCSLWT